MKSARGFSLIEILIAVSILTALLFTGTYSYQILAQRWDKEIGKYQETVNLSRNLQLLKEALVGIKAYVVLDYDTKPATPGMLFVGSKQRLLSVTQNGLFSGNYPEVFRLVIRPTSKNTFNLIYQSASFKDLLLFTAQQDIKFSHSYLILENIDSFEMKYLGWDSITEKNESVTSGARPTWRESFSGVDNQMMPDSISIQINYDNQMISFVLDTDKNGLRVISPYLEASHDE